jgi:hypothetical protein
MATMSDLVARLAAERPKEPDPGDPDHRNGSLAGHR